MNLLFYGDDPQGASGYSIQARNILKRLSNHFNIACIALNRIDENPHYPFHDDRLPFKIYRANIQPQDPLGTNLLTSVFSRMRAEVLFVMGDIWSFKGWFRNWINHLHFRKKFKTIGYFSTEYPLSREEIDILNLVDFPITHSKWGLGYNNGSGYEEIKKKVPKIIYIPDSVDNSMFFQYDTERIAKDRISLGIRPEEFIIFCVNRNTPRKDISALIRAFKVVKGKINNARLYLHCMPYDTFTTPDGTVNLLTLCEGLGLRVGRDVVFAYNLTTRHGYPPDLLCRAYNIADLFVSTSVSEGFGVTPVEALFCGKHILIPGHTGFSNIAQTCGIEPVKYHTGLRSQVAGSPVHPIDEKDLTERIIDVYEKRKTISFKVKSKKNSDLAIQHFNSNVVFEKFWLDIVGQTKKRLSTSKKEILFVQHSSAGDVFLTTGCLKGIKKRHNVRLSYMTQKKYHNIVKDNPNIDHVLDYEPSKVHEYKFVYFPHEKFILHGNWNSNDIKLGKLYSVLCDVDFETPYIKTKKPNICLPKEYIVVHAQSHPYRSYYNFHIALNGSKLPIVQIGGRHDALINKGDFKFLDARGLTYQESSYIISKAKGFVGIDSFPAHVAGSFNIPMVILFGCGAARATAPITQGVMKMIEPDYTKTCPILGPCSANYRCPNPCGPRHNPMQVKEAVKEILPDVFPDVEKKLHELLCK